ncbi:MAG TPA: hypothetical protein VF789_21065 [Thermoanaerobaculia bacterium]
MSPEPLLRRFGPRLVLLVLTAGAFLAAWRVPYKLESDTAFQVKGIQQWLAGDTPNPGTLLLPDPADLGRDAAVWSNWWPPAFPFLYAPLAAAGLPLGTALRATSLLLFLAGSLGWLRLAERLETGRSVQLLFAASLAAYALTIGGAASLRSTDLLSFAAAPWLFSLVLNAGMSVPRALLCGAVLGATYWVRYSLFLVALPLLLWLALGQALDRGRELRGRMGRMAALGAGFALPVLLLLTFNLSRSEDVGETVSGNRSAWMLEDKPAVPPLRLALSFAGAPGLALFQNDLWITHLTHFSDARLPRLRGVAPEDRRALKALLGLPATLALLWGLARERRRRPGSPVLLAVAVMGLFYLALAALSAAYHFDYLANEPRLASGFMPLAQLLALSGWLSGGGRTWRGRTLAAGALAACFALPLLFAAASFLKNDLHDRLRPPYRASRTGLLVTELSDRDVPAVTAAVRDVLRSPGDLLALAGQQGASCAYVPWLELPRRVLPMGPLCAEMGARYFKAANLRSGGRLVSSRPLRIVLVVPAGPAGEADRRRLAARIPQARTWRRAPSPAHATVAIWYSDLEIL